LAQIEIFEFLKAQREKGLEEYYTPMDIYKGVAKSEEFNSLAKCRVYSAIIQLEAFGYLEVIRKGKLSSWKRAYRIKEKYYDKPKKANGCEYKNHN